MVKRILGILWRIISIACVVIVILGTVFLLCTGGLWVIVDYFKRPPVTSLDSETFELLPEPIQKASQAVVLVRVEAAKKPDLVIHISQSPERGGSGVIVSPHYVLTAFHVASPAFGISAKEYFPISVTIEHEGKIYTATPVAFDVNFDLALLKVKEELPVQVEIASAAKFFESVDEYEDFYVVGNFPSQDDKNTFSKYIYKKHYDRKNMLDIASFEETYFIIRVECSNFHGFSGGPILNPRGEVIGIVLEGYRDPGAWQMRGTSAPLIQEFLKAALSQ